ncbi:preprotein translocase subunit SecE [Arthrobacter sp. ok362]|nr:preprotein translocase subunit SecE [Arthrobacter sp. ok362]
MVHFRAGYPIIARMSEDQVTETAASSSKGRPAKNAAKPGIFARIAIFIRQVIGELKKVVAPTRKELINYTLVVLVFVTIMMVIVTLLDLAFGTAVGWVFGGSSPTNS